MDIFNIVKYNKLWLTITLVTTMTAVALIAIFGLNFGIDFVGGTVLDYTYTSEVSASEVQHVVEDQGIQVDRVVVSGDSITIYTETLTEDQAVQIDTALNEEYSGITRVGIESVGASVGFETTKKAIRSVVLAAIAIVIYLAIAFRSVPKPANSIEFGVSVIFAMLHDVLVVLGAFAVLGHFFNAEINALFITAILTVIGFSVHDSIVVYDRIRENLKKNPAKEFSLVVNDSLIETLARSVNLSVAVLLTLIALFVLGSESIRWFVAALIIGMASGTYSSVFVGSQVLISWEQLKQKGFRSIFKRFRVSKKK